MPEHQSDSIWFHQTDGTPSTLFQACQVKVGQETGLADRHDRVHAG
jgi:hypothetical protein